MTIVAIPLANSVSAIGYLRNIYIAYMVVWSYIFPLEAKALIYCMC